MKNIYLISMMAGGVILAILNALDAESEGVYMIAGLFMIIGLVWGGLRLLQSQNPASKWSAGVGLASVALIIVSVEDSGIYDLACLMAIVSLIAVCIQLFKEDYPAKTLPKA